MERILTPRDWYDLVEYTAEVLVLASVALIWWPAYKVSRTLLVARDMNALAASTSSKKLAGFAEQIAESAKETPFEWSAADYWMLRAGFACAALSSLLKLFYLIPASHHC